MSMTIILCSMFSGWLIINLEKKRGVFNVLMTASSIGYSVERAHYLIFHGVMNNILVSLFSFLLISCTGHLVLMSEIRSCTLKLGFICFNLLSIFSYLFDS